MAKLKEFFSDIRAFNLKYKCVPLIVFALIYVASPIDLLPELFYDSWIFYLDDMAVLIFAFVITYMEVFYNERNRGNNENVEGVYTAVRRCSGELGNRRDINSNSGSDSDVVHSALVNQIPQAELPAPVFTNNEPEIIPDEPELPIPEPICEPTTEIRDASYYERQFLCNATSTNDFIRQTSEQSIPDSFIVDDGNTIIW